MKKKTTLRRMGAALLHVWLCVLTPLPALAFSDVAEVKTRSGLTAWLIEDHSLPLVSLSLRFQGVGHATDPDDSRGLTNLLVGMLEEGAGPYDALAFKQALEERAIKLSFSADDDGIRIGVSALAEELDEALRLAALALLEPHFEEEALRRVKGQIHTILLRNQKEPGYLASKRWQEEVFGDHPYRHTALGEWEEVAWITSGRLTLRAQQVFRRDNLLISAAGDVGSAALARMLERHFGALPAGPEAAVSAPQKKAVSDFDASDMTVGRADVPVTVPQSVVLFGLPGLRRSDPDFYAAYVLNYILGGGGFSSRLMEEVREKRGLVYGIGTWLDTPDHAGLWKGRFATRSASVDEAIAAVKSIFARLRKNGVKAEELADAKSYITGSFPLNLASTGDAVHYLEVMQRYGLGRDYLKKRNEIMQAVKQEDVNRVARRLIDPEKLFFVVAGEPLTDAEKEKKKQDTGGDSPDRKE